MIGPNKYLAALLCTLACTDGRPLKSVAFQGKAFGNLRLDSSTSRKKLHISRQEHAIPCATTFDIAHEKCYYRPIKKILKSSPRDDDHDVLLDADGSDPLFSGKTTISLIAGQSLLVVGAVIVAQTLSIPNCGLGPGFSLDDSSVQLGVIATLPLFCIALLLDIIEKSVPALNDVSTATQRSVLGLLGGSRKPLLALGVSLALGTAAGWGEEMLFRGVLQFELSERLGDTVALGSSAVVFGALHAVTPLYAILAGLASLYFGELYLQYHNLAVPIVCHGLYDVGALMAAHWAVSGMTQEEREALAKWEPPSARNK